MYENRSYGGRLGLFRCHLSEVPIDNRHETPKKIKYFLEKYTFFVFFSIA